MTDSHHETLVYRLSQILVKLNQGLKLDPKALADEFKVNLRTIQRDLNERFAYLPLEKVEGHYRLDPTFLGKLSTKDIERFACLAGVRGLFPSLSDDFLRDIFDDRMQGALLVKGHNYEDLRGKEKLFGALEKAIYDRMQISFDYAKEGSLKAYAGVSPYKLINHKGIWYMTALDADKVKSFSFSKIQHLKVLDTGFEWDAGLDSKISTDDGIWHSDTQREVVLKASPEVAGYFKRRKLIGNQVIEKELADGSLIISAKVSHDNQILPIVRYWMPSLTIISPESLQTELMQGLKAYLER